MDAQCLLEAKIGKKEIPQRKQWGTIERMESDTQAIKPYCSTQYLEMMDTLAMVLSQHEPSKPKQLSVVVVSSRDYGAWCSLLPEIDPKRDKVMRYNSKQEMNLKVNSAWYSKRLRRRFLNELASDEERSMDRKIQVDSRSRIEADRCISKLGNAVSCEIPEGFLDTSTMG
ncbi:hypothetical protein Tco_1326689 [Tanacetum coccineum]